eukprot:4071633-Ditylum_brightwellii.AAC.1
MDLVLDSNNYKDNKICMINYCQLYLQVATLSDLVLLDSTTLDHQFLQGQWSLLSSTSKYLKTNQAHPIKRAWYLWHKANKLWSSKGILKQLLGSWLLCGSKPR